MTPDQNFSLVQRVDALEKKVAQDAATVFDEAEAECLKNCFAVLTDSLVTDPSGFESEQRFRACRDLCRKARKIAANAS